MARAGRGKEKDGGAAMSDGVPPLLLAVWARSAARRSSVMRPRKNSVSSVNPGATTLALIPSEPRSWASVMFHASTAALAAE